MICQKCGFENTPGDRLCSKCQNTLDFRALDSQMININDLELVKEEEPQKSDEPISKSRSYKKTVILLVLLAVITGIIAVVVQPIYDAHIKARIIGEAVSATRIKVERYAREYGSWPVSARDVKLTIPEQTKDVISIKINNGVIELTVSNVPGKKARFSPSINDRGYIVWKCHHGGIGRDYLPAMCYR
jgi:hypothetical protein